MPGKQFAVQPTLITTTYKGYATMSGFNLHSVLPGRYLATATNKTFAFPLLSRQAARVINTETQLAVPYEKAYPLIGCLPEFINSPIGFFSRLANAYEELVEFNFAGMEVVLISDGDLAHQILVKEIQNFRKADRDALIMGRVLGRGLVTNTDFHHHKRQRKLVQPGFHFRRIQSYAETMSSYTTAVVNEWNSGRRDISDDMFKLTMYIVCKTLFNMDMNDMAKEADKIGRTMKIVQDCIDLQFNQLISFPNWVPTPTNMKLNKARKILNDTITSMIDTRRQENGGHINPSIEPKHLDMLSMLMDARYEDGSAMDDQLIMDELITLFVAGHETTSNALTWTIYLLSQHPDIQAKLHAELDGVLLNRDARFEDLEHLHYTEMVIKESMRLLPPAWTLNARQSNQVVDIGKYRFPKDKMVFISPYANHRNPRYFEQPDVFEPERFSAEREKAIPKHAYIPFGSGPRVCIGQSFAMMEAKLILASTLNRFKVTPDADQPFEPQAQITLSNKGGMHVVLEKRK
jgi:cytochrome P450